MVIFPLFFFIFVLFCFTKRAQAPFSSWLPLAISAPTPVRSLVHSRTLVTAGVFVLLKYNYLLMTSRLMLMMWGFGRVTLFISGIISLVERDGKKIIALRTLSQLGVLIIGLGCGYVYLVFCHLLSHAFFKRCLFIQMGVFIHSFAGGQDGRLYRKVFFLNISNFIIFLVCLIRLCGLCFTSGFISKDFLLMWDGFGRVSIIFFFFFSLSLLFTFLYSFRLLIRVFKMGRFSFFFFNRRLLSVTRGLLLVFLGVFFGW